MVRGGLLLRVNRMANSLAHGRDDARVDSRNPDPFSLLRVNPAGG